MIQLVLMVTFFSKGSNHMKEVFLVAPKSTKRTNGKPTRHYNLGEISQALLCAIIASNSPIYR